MGNKKAQKKWSKFQTILDRMALLDYASSVMSWDANVSGAPDSGADMRADAMGLMSEMYYKKMVSKKTESALKAVEAVEDELTGHQKAAIHHFKRSLKKLKSIPVYEYSEYVSLCSKSEVVWVEARRKSDYGIFKPYLEKIIDFNKRFIEYRGYDGHPYNTLVDDFEPGVTVEMLDDFFNVVKREISPLYKSISKARRSNDAFAGVAPASGQRDYVHRLVKLLGYDMSRGVVSESAHPFSMGLSQDDVRITTSYDQLDFFKAVFSAAHEAGHAIFEQNAPAGKTGHFLAKNIPYALHESQSRFYENHVAKSEPFFELEWKHMASHMNPKLKKIDARDAYRKANELVDTTIRIDSDELSYPLHIIIRYEIEKGLFAGDISVDDLPRIWNEKTLEYLGVVPENDSKGILQDIHWSGGSFGYFPTYALGSAYAAQFRKAMDSSLGVDASIRSGDLESIRKWLTDNVHTKGGVMGSIDILKMATGEDFNPAHYTSYLKDKFTRLYTR